MPSEAALRAIIRIRHQPLASTPNEDAAIIDAEFADVAKALQSLIAEARKTPGPYNLDGLDGAILNAAKALAKVRP